MNQRSVLSLLWCLQVANGKNLPGRQCHEHFPFDWHFGQTLVSRCETNSWKYLYRRVTWPTLLGNPNQLLWFKSPFWFVVGFCSTVNETPHRAPSATKLCLKNISQPEAHQVHWKPLTFSVLSKQTEGPFLYRGLWASSQGLGPSAGWAESGTWHNFRVSYKQHSALYSRHLWLFPQRKCQNSTVWVMR